MSAQIHRKHTFPFPLTTNEENQWIFTKFFYLKDCLDELIKKYMKKIELWVRTQLEDNFAPY